jgi:hypothetical protein
METSRNRIIDALETSPGGLCDDCLSEVAQVFPRQQVNQICRPLFQASTTDRQQRSCPRCDRVKLVNRLVAHASTYRNRPRPETSFMVAEQAIDYAHPGRNRYEDDDAAWLDGIRRKLLDILKSVEGTSAANDGVAKMIARLEDTDALPRVVCCMMRTLNSLRNAVVYEKAALGNHERKVVESAWTSVEEWWRAQK